MTSCIQQHQQEQLVFPSTAETMSSASTSQPTTSIPHKKKRSTSKKQQQTVVHRWLCDKCKVASFKEFQEAVDHEEQCGKQPQPQQQQSQVASTIPESTELHANTIPSKPISMERMERNETVEAAPIKMVTSISIPAKARKSSTRQVKRKQNTKVAAALSSLTIPTEKAKSHSFFQPKTLKQQETVKPPVFVSQEIDSSGNSSSSDIEIISSTVAPFPTGTLPNQLLLPQKRTAEVIDMSHDSYDSSSTCSSDVAAAEAAQLAISIEQTLVSTNKRKHGKNKMARIFLASGNASHAALLAEQRQVEFQAKRRLQRQQELQRVQRKQQTKESEQVSAKTCSSLSDAFPTISNAPPLAPRFPIPSHLVPGTERCFDISSNNLNKRWLSLERIQAAGCVARRPLSQEEISVEIQSEATGLKLLAGTDHVSERQSPDLLYSAIGNLLQPSNERRLKHKKISDDNRLWVDKYGLSVNGTILSSQNQSSADRVLSWIDLWRNARDKAMERMAKRQSKLKGAKKKSTSDNKRRKRTIDPDNDLWKDDDELDEFNLCNLCLITGPTSSGKSSLVHAMAKKAQCNVLEINTSANRGGTSLKHRIQEATQSCSSLDLLNKQKEIATSMFAPAVLEDTDDENDTNDSGSDDESSRDATSTLTVILIDEIDIVDDSNEDSGFWSALAAVARIAKCPIVLTANEAPAQLKSFRYEHIKAVRPTPESFTPLLLQIIQQEQLSIRKGLAPDTIRKYMTAIAKLCNCDIRRVMNELQSHSARMDLGKEDASIPAFHLEDFIPEMKSSQFATNIPYLPTIHTIEPRRIVMDKYTVLKISGSNFEKSSADVGVFIGDHPCTETKVLDDKTILALVSPFDPSEDASSLLSTTKFATVKIYDKKHSSQNSRSWVDDVGVDCLPDGTMLPCCKIHTVEWCPANKDDAEIAEGDDRPPTTSFSDRIDAMTMLNGFEAKTATTPKPLEREVEINSSDDDLFTKYQSLSDAVYLADMMEGLPQLAGPCQGFGYDLVDPDDQMKVDGKLRKRDKAKRPTEETLMSCGWKDDCFFFGQRDSYVTLPNSRERRLIASECNLRGRMAPLDKLQAAGESANDDAESSDATMAGTPGTQQVSLEDMFAVPAHSSSLCALPQILGMKAFGDGWWRRNSCDIFVAKQIGESHRMQAGLINPICSNYSRRSFCNASKAASPGLFLDYLPILRRMAVIERCNGTIFDQQNSALVVSSKRKTRSSAKVAYVHYFDTISTRLRFDVEDLSSAEVGSALATKLLSYTA